MLRSLSHIIARWMVRCFAKGSHVKLKRDLKEGVIIFPNHGSQELGKGLEKKLFKQAGIKI